MKAASWEESLIGIKKGLAEEERIVIKTEGDSR